MAHNYFIGIDYGSDSARAVLCDEKGNIISTSTMNYPRWCKGMYCTPSKQIFRQHPQDYLDVLEHILKEVVKGCPDPKAVKGIAMDSTCSTPGFVDEHLRPLALQEKYFDDPDAMFLMWKDHSFVEEAAEITALCAQWKEKGLSKWNFASHCGSNYSPECYWAKVLNVFRRRRDIQAASHTLLELCDYIPVVLTGCHSLGDFKASHCAASAKHLWSEQWNGFAPDEFFDTLDPALTAIRHNMADRNHYCVEPSGTLCAEWAAKTGLSTDVVVGVGNIDSYAGATAAGVNVGTMVMNIGTAGCFMTEMPSDAMADKDVPGVFGQVDGGIRKGQTLYEVGMSAFGDMFAWLKRLLSYDAKEPETLLYRLGEEAQALPLDDEIPLATDSFNGRRSPRPNDALPASLMGLKITTTPAEVYHALVQAAAFATRMNIEHLAGYGIHLSHIMAVGGVAQKSPFVMQTLADITGHVIDVLDCKDSCALGDAMFAAVASGRYGSIEEAVSEMKPGIMKTYTPAPQTQEYYAKRYVKYLKLSDFTEENS